MDGVAAEAGEAARGSVTVGPSDRREQGGTPPPTFAAGRQLREPDGLPAGARIEIRGVVQGVGFRPFVYALARQLSLTGWVRNTSGGVELEVDGSPSDLQEFIARLRLEAPPLAHIDSLAVREQAANGFSYFEILHSRRQPGAFQPVSPDVALCEDCLRELNDPNDRRYRYPFINCTNCGPRFTIIRDIPYDRPLTSMAAFEMCPDCAAEYADPLDRRFHAQPVACPACGPQIWLEADGMRLFEREQALQEARRMIREGSILAIKGLGGFHLACDATNPHTVGELRRRKLRVDKPFAIMLPDLAAVQAHCAVEPADVELLLSPQRPIVLLERRATSTVVEQVAPGQRSLAAMLPYSPLHVLLLERQPGFPEALVMTSGNLSEEPIAIENGEARQRLARLADAFLMHDREIETRCDDPVMRSFAGAPYPLRRSRGYAPFPVRLPWEAPPLLAAGAELKNTFCLTRGDYAFLSHHIGDLENYETLRSFERAVEHFERLFRVQPQAVAYDLHPDYLASRYALQRAEREGLPTIGVQHHHAHVAACMAEHGLDGEEPVIGVVFDGTGYGDDGAIWGGEFLVADYRGYRRAAHLAYFQLPGGDAAVREPWRVALALMRQAGLGWEADLPLVAAGSEAAQGIVLRMLKANLHAPRTSSMGRLFDAVASLADLRHEVNYEAQAAMELEAAADTAERGAYPFDVGQGVVDPAPVVREIVREVRARVPIGTIAGRFHNGVAEMTREVCERIRSDTGLVRVALSGGVWQNMMLLLGTVERLRAAGFEVLLHRQVPANDGGLALGQAAVAAWRLNHDQPGGNGALDFRPMEGRLTEDAAPDSRSTERQLRRDNAPDQRSDTGGSA